MCEQRRLWRDCADLAWAFAVRLCDKYHNLRSWLIINYILHAVLWLKRQIKQNWNYLSRYMTKPTKWHVRPAKTQINLGWVFALRSMGSLGPKPSLSGQRRHWSDWADVQADLSLRWAHSHSVGFVMRRLKLFCLFTEISVFSLSSHNRWKISLSFMYFLC